MLYSKFVAISVLLATTISTSLVTLPALANSGAMSPERITEASQQNTPTVLIAQARRAFTVTKIWPSSIYVKSSATGNVYEVSYAGRIGAEVGDTVTVIVNSDDKWITIINERTGQSSAVTSVVNRV
jgi:flagellar basal body L-ring protein FlgH